VELRVVHGPMVVVYKRKLELFQIHGNPHAYITTSEAKALGLATSRADGKLIMRMPVASQQGTELAPYYEAQRRLICGPSATQQGVKGGQVIFVVI